MIRAVIADLFGLICMVGSVYVAYLFLWGWLG
jgi:hypothetical protein